MTECLDQLRDNRSAINSAGIMDNSSVIAQGESGTRERESCFCELSRLFGGRRFPLTWISMLRMR